MKLKMCFCKNHRSFQHNKFELVMSQSNQNQNEVSDCQSDTIQKDHSSLTIDYLLRQNQVKQKALSKATDLIELLKIQIEVERNSKLQALSDLQIKLRSQYRKQIDILKDRKQMLQRQIKRRDQLQNKTKSKDLQNLAHCSTRKTMNQIQMPNKNCLENGHNRMRRTTSSSELRKSVQNRSSLLNSSQTQISKVGALQYSIYNRNNSKQSRFSKSQRKKKAIRENIQKQCVFPLQNFSIENQIMKQLLIDVQQRQRDLLENLGFIASEQTQKFSSIAKKFEQAAEQAKQQLKQKSSKSIMQQKVQNVENLYKLSSQIIGQQWKVMNRFRVYINQLQGLISQTAAKILETFGDNSSFSLNQFLFSESEKKVRSSGSTDGYSRQINYLEVTKGCLNVSRNFKIKYDDLKSENIQLKQILDSMVTLVRQQKKNRKI